MHACMHTYRLRHTDLPTGRPAYRQTCIHTDLHTYRPAYIQTCIHTDLHTYRPAYMQTCIHADLHTYRPAYRQTCIQTDLQTDRQTFGTISQIFGPIKVNAFVPSVTVRTFPFWKNLLTGKDYLRCRE